MRAKIIKLLEEKIGQKLRDITFGNDFLDMTKMQQQKKKQINWTSLKFKTLYIKKYY